MKKRTVAEMEYQITALKYRAAATGRKMQLVLIFWSAATYLLVDNLHFGFAATVGSFGILRFCSFFSLYVRRLALYLERKNEFNEMMMRGER